MKHYTNKDLLQYVADGHGTFKEIADKFGSRVIETWKSKLVELGFSWEDGDIEPILNNRDKIK